MVLLGRIELPTSPLPRVRSTTELQQRPETGAPYCRAVSLCQADLKSRSYKANAFRMSENPRKNMSREERLAASLRENLRRRKAQARALGESDRTQPLPKGASES